MQSRKTEVRNMGWRLGKAPMRYLMCWAGWAHGSGLVGFQLSEPDMTPELLWPYPHRSQRIN